MKPTLPPPPAAVRRTNVTAAHALARDAFGREVTPSGEVSAQPDDTAPPTDAASPARKETATDAIGRRAGALSDELAFPEFVASLVHGTFDAIVDSSIRQMESFGDLVAAVAKPLDQFTQENVSLNQARDWLAEQHPKDLAVAQDGGTVRLEVRAGADPEEPPSPDWLADYGLQGEQLTSELVEEQILPKARERVARNRLQTLSTMVLLGMNRVVVRDGTIGARLRFRAAAADRTRVDYAVSNDGGEAPGTEWGTRGSRSYDAPRTMVSTVGVNVQSDSDLKAELFGEVKINFASETVPLDRFVDDARRNVLERHARPAARSGAATPSNTPATSASAPGAPAADRPPSNTTPVLPAPSVPDRGGA